MPSLAMPLLMVSSLSPNLLWMLSRRRKRATRNAKVAPMVLQKETMTVPVMTPNRAPPSRVMIAAPGSESAVTAI